ncbi:MAG: hypothetical protein PXY39_02155 [archaeon]|nr:hypothetical protein [archaeon]
MTEERYYEGIGEIKEARSAEEANKLLSQSWEILRIAEETILDLTRKESRTSLFYVLGKRRQATKTGPSNSSATNPSPSTQVQQNEVKSTAVHKDPPSPLQQPPKQTSPQKATAQSNAFTLKLETPVLESEAPFSSFYVNRILTGFKNKYPDFHWSFSKDANGAITQISFAGIVKDHEDEQKKELQTTLGWAVKRVSENRKGKR